MAVNSKFEITNENILELNIDTIEEILNMPVMGEVQNKPTLPNIDCIEHNDLYKNKTHDISNHGLFCVTGKNLGCTDIDDLFC